MGYLNYVSDLLWGPHSVLLIFGIFLYISYRAKFPQRQVGRAMRTAFSGEGKVYKSLSVSLAAVLGVGNIIGVALAVSLGGPGAVFWCLLAGVAGIGAQYAECLVSLKHKRRGADGAFFGGPMYAMRDMGHSARAALYASAVTLCGIAMGALTPANSICAVFNSGSAGVHPLVISSVVALLAGVLIFAGAKPVFDFCAGVVPVMVALFAAACVAVLAAARDFILPALGLIMREAFTPESAIAGAAGYGIARAARWGLARGLFSSEAGMGTAGISAAAAGRGSPELQALGCACSTVWDTVILATLTGVTFVTAALYGGCGFGDALALAENAFSLIPVLGEYILPVFITSLGFLTVIGWYYIARQAFDYLTRGRTGWWFSLAWVTAVAAGGAAPMELAWTLCDILCILILVPNLITSAEFLRTPGGSRKKHSGKLNFIYHGGKQAPKRHY